MPKEFKTLIFGGQFILAILAEKLKIDKVRLLVGGKKTTN